MEETKVAFYEFVWDSAEHKKVAKIIESEVKDGWNISAMTSSIGPVEKHLKQGISLTMNTQLIIAFCKKT